MAVRRPLILDGGNVKELPSGDTVEGAVSIDDAATNTTQTWSSTKISAEVAAAGASTTTTPAPQLSANNTRGQRKHHG